MSRKSIVTDPTVSIADRLQAPSEGKFIAYDRLADGEYAMFLDRNFLGYASSYSEAEQKISAVYYDQLTHTQIETSDLEALPFEPTQAELEAYEKEWDAAVADEQTALETYAAEWDAEADYLEAYGNPELDAIIRRWLADAETDATLPPVDVTYTPLKEKPEDGYLSYTAGNVKLFVDRPDRFEIDINTRDNDNEHLHPCDLRALIAICDRPDVRQWAGLTPKLPPVHVVPHIQDADELDAGQHTWTDYITGVDQEGYETSVYMPVVPSPFNPGDCPNLYLCGEDAISLDAVEYVLPQIIALVESPVVRAAREHYRQQRERQKELLAIVPEDWPQGIRSTIIEILTLHPDDPQAQAAAFRAAAERMAV